MFTGNIIIIGASTGGPRTLEEVLAPMPRLRAAVVIVQHTPPKFDRSFAELLDTKIQMDVRLAAEGDPLREGLVYVAPSGVHLALEANTTVRLRAGEKVNYVCPAIDVTMRSVTRHRGGALVGVILTGMGHDGADGLAAMKAVGAVTIAQDEKSSVIFGMPRAAIEAGCVDHVLSPMGIGGRLLKLVGAL
jgi:two-component system chemotaxis response regulator CheB